MTASMVWTRTSRSPVTAAFWRIDARRAAWCEPNAAGATSSPKPDPFRAVVMPPSGTGDRQAPCTGDRAAAQSRMEGPRTARCMEILSVIGDLGRPAIR